MNQITVFTQDYPVNTTVLDTNARLGLTGILNLLQDISILHPESFGQGYLGCLHEGYFWVLSQQKLHMKRWPVWHETLTIQTWVRDIGSISATRECALFVGNELVGECAMLLIRVDVKTRRPKRISDTSQVTIAETGKPLDFKAEKVSLPEDLQLAIKHTVKVSDLDMNQHVNNTKYAEWFLDSLPIGVHQNCIITSYEVNFLTETFLQDEVCCYSNIFNNKAENIVNEPSDIYFYGKRSSDNKKLFTAKMTTSQL